MLHPDVFLLKLLDRWWLAEIDALETGVQDHRGPPETLIEWMGGLATTVPGFANAVADALK